MESTVLRGSLSLVVLAATSIAVLLFTAPTQAAAPGRTCGLLPGQGAYSYTQVRGITCRRGTKIAFRAHRKFCNHHNECVIDPTTMPITTLYKGKVRYGAWTCRVMDGWELLSVFCHSGAKRVLHRSGA